MLSGSIHMAASKVELAKRALVTLLLSFALACSVALSLNCDVSDAVVLKGYRRVILKVQKAQATANNIALRLKKTCRLVVMAGGAAVCG